MSNEPDQSAPIPFEPGNATEAYALAEGYAKSELVPQHLRGKPFNIVVTMAYGRELGLSPIQAMTSIHVVDGRPRMSSQLTVALVKRNPLCKYFRIIKSDDNEAIYETLRDGDPEPTRLGFTMEQAKMAGLAGRDNWRKYPAAMLRSRAAMFLAREAYPDLVANIYDPDEIDNDQRRDLPTRQPQTPSDVVRQQVQAKIEEAKKRFGIGTDEP